MVMINLKNRTEYSFRTAFGVLDNVLATKQGESAGICDRYGTWGHVMWDKKCKKLGIKPIFGTEFAVVNDMNSREKQGVNHMALLAINDAGLKQIYGLVGLSYENFYYTPRIDYGAFADVVKQGNVIGLSGASPDWDKLPKHANMYIELNPSSQNCAISKSVELGLQLVATSDNYFCIAENRKAFEMAIGRDADSKTTPQHILDEAEWRVCHSEQPALDNASLIADRCNATLEHAELVKPERPASLRELCERGAIKRNLDITKKEYADRLTRELDLIYQKEFEDYFYLVGDLCEYAKKHMLVGPARGSSCGSLVCYLLNITDVDPLPYGLLFERFIDLNRADLPDIDIDFPDTRREMVFDYLRDKYGYDNVARIGTISRFKPKSAIDDVARALKLPSWEMVDLKGAIIERSGADARAAFCLADTFNDLEIGKKMLAKYPQLAVAGEIEGHARHTGEHAAAMVVTSKPIVNYGSVDERTRTLQLDKHSAEAINLLKIDCLGLRTLSVIQDCLESVGKTVADLHSHPLDDKKAYQLIADKLFTGIFQFEGYALQSLANQMEIKEFEDLVVVTALARPGPIISGGTTEFMARRRGDKEIDWIHPSMKPHTQLTLGIVVYQEQVMQIAREVGKLSWEDVSELRKACSKSLGKEYFDKFYVNFEKGALENGLELADIELIWKNINTMGSWAFNRSHSVAYALVSYWCMVMKANHPLEYACASLSHPKDKQQPLDILREITNFTEYDYKPFDKEKSQYNWSVDGKTLYGGLIGIKGVGDKLATDIISRRKEGRKLTARQEKLLTDGITEYDHVFEARDRFGHVLDNPGDYNINTPITPTAEIQVESDGQFVIIGKVTMKNLRDANEEVNVLRRGYRINGQSMFLNIEIRDDSGSMILRVGQRDYLRIGKSFVDEAKLGDWYLFKGYNRKGFKMLHVKRMKKITGNPEFAKKEGASQD